MRRGRSADRGAALVELVLVLPLFIAMILFSVFFVELVRTKLKLQEASRYLAWEMTSYVLTDFGGGRPTRHQEAFAVARTKAMTEVTARFVDLDSIEDRSPDGTLVGYRDLKLEMRNQKVEGFDATMQLKGGALSSNPLNIPLLDFARGQVAPKLEQFGFNLEGQVRVELSVAMDNHLLPRNYLDGPGGFFTVDLWGGHDLGSLTLRDHLTLISSGWNLTDGSDALMHSDRSPDGPRAGVHTEGVEHGLHKQVKAMNEVLGVDRGFGLKALKGLKSFLPLSLPDGAGAFVVSHNYGLAEGDAAAADLRDCRHNELHPAKDGMNNLAKYSTIDAYKGRGTCYDTAPFRELVDYSESPSIQIFSHRGKYFMGCKQPMADDPTEAGPVAGDRNTVQRACEDT